LKLNSLPIASVTLDGTPIGDTPRANVLAAPGEHRAVFSAGAQEKTLTFRCADDEDKALAVRLP
jgi:hypothetical protein